MPWGQIFQWLGAVGVPLGGFYIGYLTYVQSKKKDRRTGEHELIDQLQEQITDLRNDLNNQGRVINTQADYIGVLRQHIAAGKPPPPPPYPEGMRV